MDPEQIKPQDARRLRAAFQKTDGKELDEKHQEVRCDHADIRWDNRYLCYIICLVKDGEVVASAPIKRRDFKRLKNEMAIWDSTRSNELPGYVFDLARAGAGRR